MRVQESVLVCPNNIGRLHEAVRTFTHDFPPPLGFLFVRRGTDKNTKQVVTNHLTGFKISLNRVCVLIFSSYSYTLELP